MSFDYFYGQQSDLFTFYRVPKVLFTNERFWNISADAKMLYGILLDRMSLSAKNGWIDKNGRVYIIFTIDEAKMALNCAEQKAIKLLSELEKKAGLIERKRQGLGKPNLIYVKNFISAVDSQLLNCENHNSGTMEITTQELPKSQDNNTDIKNTEFSDTDSIFPSGNGGMMDENDRYQEYFDYFSDQLSIDLLKKDYPYDSEMLDNILELIVETVCTKRPLIRIGAEERPAEIVRSRFMKLNVEHIRYVMDCFKENTTKIRNIRQYMLTTIYNAPTTIDTYYDALVRHDMSHGYLEGGFKKLKMKREEGERRKMSKKATIIAVVNQKGGTGKTTTENLGVGLALEGKNVLLVDTDPQASLTVSLGNPCPDDLSPTLSDLMGKIMMENPIAPDEGILHHPEGVDLVPSNIELPGMEVALVNAMSRETILRQYLDTVKQNYDYILLDCMPSLGMLTVNALAAADNVLIPVQAAYLPAKGLEQLLGTINKVKRQINPKLKIEGILLTMVDSRTNYSKDISNLIRESYGGKLKVYKTDIPRSVRAEEISAEGTSIFKYDPKGKVAEAYKILTKEVLNNAEKRRKHQLEGVR